MAPMPLIIESYYQPYTKIADIIFPGVEFKYIDGPVSEPDEADLFCYTRQSNSREVKYYFNKIYYIEANKIVCIHKSAKQIRYYDVDTGMPVQLASERAIERPVDKSAFLPQMRAQKGDFVIFPEEDDEL